MTLKARLLAVLLFAGLMPGAAAQETLVWTQKESGGFVTLAYGPIDPNKTPLFMLSCINGADIAVLDVSTGAGDAAPGTAMTIELTNADLAAPVEAEVIHDEASGTALVEASDIDVKPILNVLKPGGPVTMKVGEATAELSDQDRAQAVEQFTKNCELA